MWREGTKQRSRTFTRKADAEAEDARLKQARRMGAFAPREPSTMTLDEWAERWITRQGITWASTTRRQRAQALDKWISPLIGHVPLRELGTERVEEWRAVVASRTTAKNTNNMTQVLSACLGAAAKSKLIPSNPVLGIGRLPEPTVDRTPLPDETVEAILAAMPSPRDRLRVALMAYAGLRPAEASGLRWSDVGDEGLVVARSVQSGKVVSTKTGATRVVAILEPMERELELHGRGTGSGYVTPGAQGGPLNHRMWERRVWSPTVGPIDPDAVPYALRHTFAHRLLVIERMDIVTAAAQLGHSPRTLLEHYAHLIPPPSRAQAR